MDLHDEGEVVCRRLEGSWAVLAHQNPTAKLPADYAEQFFLHDTSRRGANKTRSSSDIQAEIASLQARTAQLAAALLEAQAREQAAAAEQASRAAKEQELAAVKQQEKEAKQKKKALEKQLGKKK